MPRWEKLIAASALEEGSQVAIDVGGLKVLVCRVDGEFHAIEDRCSHQDASLSQGKLQGCVVTCPWHGAEFDVTTGEILRKCSPQDGPIRTFPVRKTGWFRVMIEVDLNGHH